MAKACESVVTCLFQVSNCIIMSQYFNYIDNFFVISNFVNNSMLFIKLNFIDSIKSF